MDDIKLLVELITQLGQQGKEAFIWYLVIHEGAPVIFGIYFLHLLKYVVDKFQAHTEYKLFLDKLREEMGLTFEEELRQRHKNDMIDWIRRKS